MLKILFFFLLLINGGLFAFQQGYLESLMPSNHEPTRLTQQLNADKLQLMPVVEQKPAAQPADAPAVAPPNAPPNAPADAPSGAPAGESGPAEGVAANIEKIAARIDQGADNSAGIMACTEVGNFDAPEAKRFEARLASLALGERVKRRPVQDAARHIVYIAPLGSKEAADKKAGELKRLGVDDFFIIQDNSTLQWGISLGVFKTEEAARKQLADLQKKGVRSARIGDHGMSVGKFAFQLRALDAAAKNGLEKIKADFPKQEIRTCVVAP